MVCDNGKGQQTVERRDSKVYPHIKNPVVIWTGNGPAKRDSAEPTFIPMAPASNGQAGYKNKLFNRRKMKISRGIHLKGVLGAFNDLDRIPRFQSPQLLQLLCRFQNTGG